MNIVKQIAENNPCYRAGRTIIPRGLMLHSVGCPQPSAEVFANNWNSSSAQVCVHAVLEASGNVYQLLPWNWRAWHCGGSGNNTHISVEMTEPSQIKYSSGATFVCTDVAAAREQVKGCYHTAVELFAELCRQYKLNPLTQICSHAEGCRKGIASNHGDPEHLWRQLGLSYTMDGFRQDVRAKMNRETPENATVTAIDVLSRLGVINTPSYWYAHYGDLLYLD
ncbi:MAG: N-acetylmuramoyl-L-alanine amidase family protein, partial [Oscillospiraceae bacterium]